MVYFLFIASCLLFLLCICQKAPEVTTPLGVVRGCHMKSFNGRTFSAFEGIPYAVPPLGPLRFADPQPVAPWTYVLNGTTPPMCIQVLEDNINVVEGKEDCLYINVYVPRVIPNDIERLDVVVYVHGGGFASGSGTKFGRPDYLMDREIILVSFNYRLGILGFLSTGDDVAPGNFGLKDQRLALKWVKQNIASFGGNPDSVTLTGLSAGGVCVHLHYFSPMSKGLFHRGISYSATALNMFAIEIDPLSKAKQLAVFTGCSVENTVNIVDCLRQQQAKNLTFNILKFIKVNSWLSVPFSPVIENSTNAFLSESPFDVIKQRKVLDVPWITSVMEEDGLYTIFDVIQQLDMVNERWTELSQIFLFYENSLPKDLWALTGSTIRKFYFEEGEDISLKTVRKFGKILTDRMYLTGADSSVRYISQVVRSPIYLYNFNYKGTHSFSQTKTKDNRVFGTVHGDDTLYIYTPFFLNSSIPPSKNDLEVKELFLDFIVGYAKTGVPKFGNVEWKPVTNDALTYINITNATRIEPQTVRELCIKELWQVVGLLDTYN